MIDQDTMLIAFCQCIHTRSLGHVVVIADSLDDKTTGADLTMAMIPFPETDDSLYYVSGDDGFPAIGIRENADIKKPYRLVVPERLYQDFSITAVVRPDSPSGGFLFAVVDPTELIVQLGVSVSLIFPLTHDSQEKRVILYLSFSAQHLGARPGGAEYHPVLHESSAACHIPSACHFHGRRLHEARMD